MVQQLTSPRGAAISLAIIGFAVGVGWSGPERSLKFEVTARPGLLSEPVSGRLIVVAVPVDGRQTVEPRHRIGVVGSNATPIAAVDVNRFTSGQTLVIDETAIAFPMDSLAVLGPDEYIVQVVLDVSRDLRFTDAPGNWHSRPKRISVDQDGDDVFQLELTEQVPPAAALSDTEYVRYIRLPSERLSRFHGRPIFLRASVIVPAGFDQELRRRYPMRVSIGGYGERHTRARWLMRPGSVFRRAWLATDSPRMLRVLLDGAGPYGDTYQVNSDNNGPYGDAIIKELIPYIEEHFRGVGDPASRVVDGVSTGGWVALALQVFYPDYFSGVWSYCPDAIDFRAFQLINIYDDDNVYVDNGVERPSRRNIDGSVRFTMRHEVSMENVLGSGNSWTLSGRQWGAWNAAYGPRSEDILPVPLWGPVSGIINRDVTAHWEQYDLRLVVARNWTTLAPKLDGKINIWVGEMDDYYLNRAVHMFDDFLATASPSFKARIVYGAGEGHCWVPHTPSELLREMGTRVGAKP